MRLVNHIGGQSPKGIGMRAMVRSEFRKNAGETDSDKIEALRAGAVRALSNYLLYESGSKDPVMKQRMAEQVGASGASGGGMKRGAGNLVPPPNPIEEDRARLAKADEGIDGSGGGGGGGGGDDGSGSGSGR